MSLRLRSARFEAQGGLWKPARHSRSRFQLFVTETLSSRNAVRLWRFAWALATGLMLRCTGLNGAIVNAILPDAGAGTYEEPTR